MKIARLIEMIKKIFWALCLLAFWRWRAVLKSMTKTEKRKKESLPFTPNSCSMSMPKISLSPNGKRRSRSKRFFQLDGTAAAARFDLISAMFCILHARKICNLRRRDLQPALKLSKPPRNFENGAGRYF